MDAGYEYGRLTLATAGLQLLCCLRPREKETITLLFFVICPIFTNAGKHAVRLLRI